MRRSLHPHALQTRLPVESRRQVELLVLPHREQVCGGQAAVWRLVAAGRAALPACSAVAATAHPARLVRAWHASPSLESRQVHLGRVVGSQKRSGVTEVELRSGFTALSAAESLPSVLTQISPVR